MTRCPIVPGAVLAALLAVPWASGLGPAAPVAAQVPRAVAQASDTLSLEEALTLALQASPALRQAQAARLQAHGGRWDSLGRLLPSVSVSTELNGTRAFQRTATDPITGGIVELPDSLVDRRQTYGTQLTVGATWTLFDGGQPVAALGASRARDRAAESGLGAARVQVTADVVVAYLDALEVEALTDVQRHEVVRATELERTAQARFDIGAAPEVELLQAQLALSDAELALLEAEGAARVARMTLLEVVGLPPDPGVTLLEPPPLDIPEDYDALRARALEGSPVLEQVEAERAAARWDARGLRLSLLPSVSLGYGWGRSEYGGSRDAFTFDPRNSGSSLRLTLSWSALQQPGGVLGERLRAEATEVAADAEREAARAALERELVAGLDRLERARVLLSRIGVSLSLAERQLAQAEERYRLGLAPLAELLDAERLYADAARQEAAARHAPVRAIAQIERATGVALWLAELR